MSANDQETNSSTETPGLDPFLELMTAMRIDFSPTEQGRTMVAEWVAHIRGLDEPTGKAEKLASYIERYLITEPVAERERLMIWYAENGIDPETGEYVTPVQGPANLGATA